MACGMEGNPVFFLHVHAELEGGEEQTRMLASDGVWNGRESSLLKCARRARSSEGGEEQTRMLASDGVWDGRESSGFFTCARRARRRGGTN